MGIGLNLYSRPGDKAATRCFVHPLLKRHIIPAHLPDNAGTLKEKGQYQPMNELRLRSIAREKLHPSAKTCCFKHSFSVFCIFAQAALQPFSVTPHHIQFYIRCTVYAKDVTLQPLMLRFITSHKLTSLFNCSFRRPG